jgi:hypothetical protein
MAETIKIGFVGDSVTYRELATNVVIDVLENTYGLSVISVVKGYNGSQTSEWTSGSIFMNDALSAFSTAGIEYVSVCLGINDSSMVRSREDVKSNLINICSTLVTAGYKVILHQPEPAVLPVDGYTVPMQEAGASYDDLPLEIYNNSTIFLGDMESRAYFTAHRDELADGVHDTETSATHRGMFWAKGISKCFFRNAMSARRQSFQKLNGGFRN